jgi:hypothetical protein
MLATSAAESGRTGRRDTSACQMLSAGNTGQPPTAFTARAGGRALGVGLADWMVGLGAVDDVLVETPGVTVPGSAGGPGSPVAVHAATAAVTRNATRVVRTRVPALSTAPAKVVSSRRLDASLPDGAHRLVMTPTATASTIAL